MVSTDYKAWEDAQTAKCQAIADGIARLRQKLNETKNKLTIFEREASGARSASIQLESIPGPFGTAHTLLRQAIDHIASRTFRVEVAVPVATLLAQVPTVSIPPRVINVGSGQFDVSQDGPLTVTFPQEGSSFSEGKDRIHAEVPLKISRGASGYRCILKLCLELHRIGEGKFRVDLATRPLPDGLPGLSPLLESKVLRALPSAVSAAFPRTVVIPVPQIASLPSLSLYCCRLDWLPRFYLSFGTRLRYTLGFVSNMPADSGRVLGVDTNLFREVIARQLQSRGVSLATNIVVYPAENAMAFDVYKEDGLSGRVEIRDPIFGKCISCFDWGIRLRITVPVKVRFQQRDPRVIAAQPRQNGSSRISVVNEFPGNLLQLLPQYWVYKAAIEVGLNRVIGPLIEQDSDVFSDSNAANVNFSLNDPLTTVVVYYPR